MRWDIEKCPECGEEPEGTLEIVQGRANILRCKDGSFEWEGYTQIFWDGQKTVKENGKDVLLCPNGHEWLAERIA